MAVLLWRTNRSVWLECTLEAEISNRKNIKLNLHLWNIYFLARIAVSQLKLNSFLLSAHSRSTSGQLWYSALPTHGSQHVVNNEIRTNFKTGSKRGTQRGDKSNLSSDESLILKHDYIQRDKHGVWRPAAWVEEVYGWVRNVCWRQQKTANKPKPGDVEPCRERDRLVKT